MLRLARLARAAALDGLVCAPHEVADAARCAWARKPVLVVPGIRPAGAAADDQARVMTPARGGRAAGADWLVVGRPITRASVPGSAAASIAAEIGA